MKQSLGTHDIYVLVNELKNWIGFRVLNIYDIDSKTICIKFNSLESEKKYLVIESGTKLYQLNSFTALKDIPGSFCAKLRKHLDNKRLESIHQINLDRVIDLQFGTGEFSYHIIGEFYGSGNIIFTNYQYKILTLIHPWTYVPNNSSSINNFPDTEPINLSKSDTSNIPNAQDVEESKIKVSVGHIYPFDYATTQVNLTNDSIREMFEIHLMELDKKIKLKQFVSKLPIIKFSPNVLEHCFKSLSIDTNKKISKETKLIGDIFASSDQIVEFINLINGLFEQDNFVGLETMSNIYPYKYAHLNPSDVVKTYSTFLEALSKHFMGIKPIETKELAKKKEAEVKLSKQEKAIWNIQQQINLMESNINHLEHQVDTVTENITKLDEIFGRLKSKLIDTDQLFGNEFQFIDLVQHKNVIKFKINDELFELDYTKSIWENRDLLYSKIKKIKEKKLNTMSLIEKQIKQLEKTNRVNKNCITDKDTINKETYTQVSKLVPEQKIISKYEIKAQTKSLWFEQFNWFFTSDNLLFISGKTADQNEQIVKKYMGMDDIYVHSDVFGSGSGVIKNPHLTNISETCPKSLIEAGTFLIAHTKAWTTGVPNPAYWVRPNQVSKTPESGEYLTKGSFIIRGQKNFIRVDKMELGFGILFKVKCSNENSVSNDDLVDTNIDDVDVDIGSNGDYGGKFVGTVGLLEQIVYAIPIVSTYSALSTCKFKVKMIPGTQKIKKALGEVISMFTKKANFHEKDAIKKIPNDSIQRVLVTGVRFVLPK
jgi:predicted ribosome quality control (RQC) complex YloA/Tae2 family protein